MYSFRRCRALGLFLPGAWFSSWYVVSIDTGHIAQSPQSGPRWSPAFKTEPALFPPSDPFGCCLNSSAPLLAHVLSALYTCSFSVAWELQTHFSLHVLSCVFSWFIFLAFSLQCNSSSHLSPWNFLDHCWRMDFPPLFKGLTWIFFFGFTIRSL